RPRDHEPSKRVRSVFCPSHSVLTHCSRPCDRHFYKPAPKYSLREPTYNFRVVNNLVLSFLSGRNKQKERGKAHDDTETTFALVIRGHHSCIRNSAGASAN